VELGPEQDKSVSKEGDPGRVRAQAGTGEHPCQEWPGVGTGDQVGWRQGTW
jgi:hypothetical protein